MPQQVAVADVERLVVDEQPDDLAVRDVDDRLAGVRVAVGGLGVRQRPDLVEGVEVGAGQRERLALVEVAAQADVAVGQREDRLALPEQVEVQAALAHGPRLDVVDLALDHDSSSSSARSSTTTSAPWSRSVVGLAGAVDADDPAEVAGAPGLDARQRVLEDGRLGRLDAQLPRRPARNVSGAGLPGSSRSLGHDAVDARLEEVLDARPRRRTSRLFALEDTTARRSPRSRAASRSGSSPRRPRRPRSLDELQDERRSCGRRASRTRLLLGIDAARLQERRARRRSAGGRRRRRS